MSLFFVCAPTCSPGWEFEHLFFLPSGTMLGQSTRIPFFRPVQPLREEKKPMLHSPRHAPSVMIFRDAPIRNPQGMIHSNPGPLPFSPSCSFLKSSRLSHRPGFVVEKRPSRHKPPSSLTTGPTKPSYSSISVVSRGHASWPLLSCSIGCESACEVSVLTGAQRVTMSSPL